MIAWLKKYNKIFFFILLLFPLFGVLLLYNQSCSNCLEGYWSKILISLITVSIALVELGDVFEEGNTKKRTLYLLFIVLFLTTIFDTGKESNDFQIEAKKRDSLIKVDSIRFVKIVNNLSTSITKLEGISGSVITSFNELLNVKKSMSEQKLLLNNISVNTSRSYEETSKLIEDNQPKIALTQRNIKTYFNHNDSLKIEVYPANIGNGIAKDLKIFYQILYLEKTGKASGNVSLMYDCDNPDNLFPTKWNTLKQPTLPSRISSYSNNLILSPCLSKKDFNNNNKHWILVYSVSYKDYKNSEKQNTITLSGSLGEDGQFKLAYNFWNLEVIKEYLEKNFQLGQYIFDYQH